MASSTAEKYLKRQMRERRRLRAVAAPDRLRLSVHRASKNIYAQVINDALGVTVASASSSDASLSSVKGSAKAGAEAVGKLIAEKAKAAGVTNVYFDRGGYMFHGRVKALADAARAAGLNF
jgi:large subunit ribosomal protein L18